MLLRTMFKSTAFHRASQGSVRSQAAILMAGTGVAQLLALLAAPVLTGLLSPERLGGFAVFSAVAVAIGVIATGRYEYAIVLPEKDNDAANVFALVVLLVALVATVITCVILAATL